MTLREHRREVLFESIATVAERAEVSESWLSLVERGASPAAGQIKGLCKAYRLSKGKFRSAFAETLTRRAAEVVAGGEL